MQIYRLLAAAVITLVASNAQAQSSAAWLSKNKCRSYSVEPGQTEAVPDDNAWTVLRGELVAKSGGEQNVRKMIYCELAIGEHDDTIDVKIDSIVISAPTEWTQGGHSVLLKGQIVPGRIKDEDFRKLQGWDSGLALPGGIPLFELKRGNHRVSKPTFSINGAGRAALVITLIDHWGSPGKDAPSVSVSMIGIQPTQTAVVKPEPASFSLTSEPLGPAHLRACRAYASGLDEAVAVPSEAWKINGRAVSIASGGDYMGVLTLYCELPLASASDSAVMMLRELQMTRHKSWEGGRPTALQAFVLSDPLSENDRKTQFAGAIDFRRHPYIVGIPRYWGFRDTCGGEAIGFKFAKATPVVPVVLQVRDRWGNDNTSIFVVTSDLNVRTSEEYKELPRSERPEPCPIPVSTPAPKQNGGVLASSCNFPRTVPYYEGQRCGMNTYQCQKSCGPCARGRVFNTSCTKPLDQSGQGCGSETCTTCACGSDD